MLGALLRSFSFGGSGSTLSQTQRRRPEWASNGKRAVLPVTGILACIFFASGAVSLTFQVAWERLLTLYYGVGPVSITLIVSIYMLGLGFGSLLGGRIADRTRCGIFWYAGIEMALGVFGVLSLPFLDWLGRGTAGAGIWVALLCISVFLCLPTLAMGMTLPLLVKVFSQSGAFLESVGFLYFVNTLGAACGALLASFALISFLGLDRTIYCAAAVDFCLGLGAWAASRRWAHTAPVTSPPGQDSGHTLGRAALVCVFVTGFAAIGYELAWFRLLQVLVKDSPYAFSSTLAVYLTGLALGSWAMTCWLRPRPARGREQPVPPVDRRNLFFTLQFLLGFCVLAGTGAYYYLTRYTRFGLLTQTSFSFDVHPGLSFPRVWSWHGAALCFSSLDIFFWPAFFVLVPTLLMGASFPLISVLALQSPRHEGRTVGAVYFFNTVGNVAGGLLTGFLILPALGTENTLRLLALVSLGMFLFVTRVWRWRLSWPCRAAALAALALPALWLFPGRGQLYAVIHPQFPPAGETYFEEGLEGVVMTFKDHNQVRNYIDGQAHGGRPGWPFYWETVETAAFATNVENVLIIGLGTGSIAEAVCKIPGLRKATLVELNSTLLTNLKKMELFRTILTHPRLELIVDDGRRFLQRTNEVYDLVLIDPLRSTTAYSNNLYSREFFELIKKRMTPAGVCMVWMDEFNVMPQTVAAVFSRMRVWEYFCVASEAPLVEHSRRREEMLAAFGAEARREIEACEIAYRGERPYALARPTSLVNQDWRPVCEYFIGLKVKQKLEPRNEAQPRNSRDATATEQQPRINTD